MRSMTRRRPTSTRCSWCSRCRGRSTRQALQAAAQALIERHASLRAALPAREPEPAGADDRAGRVGALAQHRPVVAGCGASASSGWPASWRRTAPSASTSAAPPLLRFALIRLSADEHRLVLTNHHILMDGWSMPVLVRELLTLYARHGDANCRCRG